ncbi:neuroligin-4, X-linked isoform X1 [Parasteatoda tepidariorum]|nr:neuroligin-4, X-linked isoform X1 [Parasteatoda tepidariorum]
MLKNENKVLSMNMGCLLRAKLYLIMMLTAYANAAITETQRPSTRVVSTKYGSLRGVIVTLSHKHLQPVEKFLGVPYAGVPTGSLRFMPPVTPPHWKGVRPVDKLSPVCPQKLPNISNETEALKRMPPGRLDYLKRLLPFLTNQSEDCLYLNIYAPANAGREDQNKLPVMVFIHGESYDWNSGNAYDGSVLASFGNLIVVTINFRLGLLGFLPALDESSRGNYGIMDQVAAMHWVQENIPEFGGDPKNVTVFGHGHGAAFVNLLMLSPLARGLFQRAILQSGSALSSFAIARDALTYTRQIASFLKCPTKDNAALVACLGKRPVEDILNAPLSVPDHLIAFGPTIDGVVIPGEPATLMEKQNDIFAQYDLLLGVSRIEYYFTFSSQEDRIGIEVSRRDRLLRTLVRNLFTYHLQEIFLTVVNEYTDWSKPDQHPINVLDSTVDAMGDALVVAPLIRTANYHSKLRQKYQKGTYLYVFMYQTEESYYDQRMGCIHGEDVPYVFGAPLVTALSHFHRNFTKPESSLSEAVMTYWTNFVRYGDPNSLEEEGKSGGERGRGRYEKINWPLYDSVHQKYIALAMKPKLKNHYHAHRLSFWLNLIPTLHKSAASETSSRHHQLEDHDNPLSYDGIFRERPAGDANISLFYSTTPFLTSSQQSADQITTTPFMIVTTADGSFQSVTTSNDTDTLAMTMQQATFSTVLIIAVVFGACIVAINSVICCAIFHKKDKNRADCLQKREYQLHPDGISCNSTPQSKQAHLISSVPSPMDHLPPPSFMTLATLSEAGSLPSKIMPPSVITHEPQQHPEAQPLLSTSRNTPPHSNHMHHHHPHWAPQVGANHTLTQHHQKQREQEMRVHYRDKREETTV